MLKAKYKMHKLINIILWYFLVKFFWVGYGLKWRWIY